jgi:hypothetical protein
MARRMVVPAASRGPGRGANLVRRWWLPVLVLLIGLAS